MAKIALTIVGSATSPFVRKVRLAAATLRLPLTFKLDAQWAPDARVRDSNPLLKVPVLLTPDAGPLYDSRVIIAYLEHLSGVDLRPPEAIQAIVDQRIEALADGISDAVVLELVEAWRDADKRSAAWLARQRSKIDQGAAALAEDLARGHLPLEQVTAGGLATLCTLENLSFRQPEHPWSTRHPALAEWCNIWTALPHYAETRPVPQPGAFALKL
jgi:glutathione S-transferase